MLSKKRWRWLAIAALSAALAVGAIACGDDDDEEDDGGAAATPAEAAGVSIGAADFAFTAPDEIAGGPVTITLSNTGAEPHQAQIVHLVEGKTFADLQAALGSGDENALFPLIEFAGGPGGIAPGATQTVDVTLPAGHYALLCFISSADGAPHFAKGMVKQLEVTAPAGEAAAAPATDGTVVLKDFTFELPAIAAGPMVLAIQNDGPQPHEFTILRLAEGKTVDDALAFFQPDSPPGPPPFTDAGGFQAIGPGGGGNVHVNLEAGNYFAICFVPDPATGQPHAALGMVSPFTVQ